MGANNVGGNEGYLGSLSSGARRANLEILRQLKQVKDVRATLFQLYDDNGNLRAEFTNNPTATPDFTPETGLKFYPTYGGAINEFTWGVPPGSFEGDSGLQMYSSAGTSTLMPYSQIQLVSSTSGARSWLQTRSNKTTTYTYSGVLSTTNAAMMYAGAVNGGVDDWSKYSRVFADGANGHIYLETGSGGAGTQKIYFKVNGASDFYAGYGGAGGHIKFPNTIGDKIYLYGTDYKFGIESSTLRYDANGYHRFMVSGAQKARVHSYGVTSYGYGSGWAKLGGVDGSEVGGGGTWNGVDSSGGYLLLSQNGQGIVYLRSRGAHSVLLGMNESNCLQVTDTYSVSNYSSNYGIRLGSWVSNGGWTASAAGNTGYLLVGTNSYASNGSACYLRANAGGPLYLSAGGGYIRMENWIKLDSMNGGAGYLLVDGSGYMYTSSSKRELKENITPLKSTKDVGAMIDSLEPVSFIFKNLHPEFGELSPEADEWRKNDVKYGFIAEDVAAVDEKLALWEIITEDEVDENGDPVYEDDPDPEVKKPKKKPTGEMVPSGWDYAHMVALLVAEVQSLRARVADLEGAKK